MSPLDRLTRPSRAVSRRIRLQRALDAGVLLGVAGLGLGGLVLGLAKAGLLGDSDAQLCLAAAACLPLVGALCGLLRPLPALLPSLLLDRSHNLHSRLTSATEFLASPAGAQTEFMKAAIDDAVVHAASLRPATAMPIRPPRAWSAFVALALALALLSALEVRVPLPPRERQPALLPLLLGAEDLDAFSEGLDELAGSPETDEGVRDAARQFNQLIEALADRRLERTEALRRITELQRRLADGRPADADALRDALRELGKEFERAELTRAASEALRDGDARRAEASVRELAEQLRQNAPTRQELNRLRDALRRAAERQMPDREREIEQRRNEVERLLQRQNKQGLNERERRLLNRRRRQLERLERQQTQQEAQRRQLERLQRELSRAAEQLNQRAQEEAADSLDRGAEDLNRMARQQMSDEQMRDLQNQLRQLRELMRRQQQNQGQQQGGQGQGGQQGRMKRFVLRAGGQQGGGQGTRLVMPGGQQGQGQGEGQGEGQQGAGGQKVLKLGRGGGNAQLEIPGMGQGQGQPQAGRGSSLGPGAGTGHDPTLLDDPTHLSSTRRNVRVEGEQGQGPTRSEVIMSAADRGFAGRRYRNVYTDYEGHAEEVLERDEVPAGYRFYIRRYFQLIRPREESPQ